MDKQKTRSLSLEKVDKEKNKFINNDVPNQYQYNFHYKCSDI